MSNNEGKEDQSSSLGVFVARLLHYSAQNAHECLSLQVWSQALLHELYHALYFAAQLPLSGLEILDTSFCETGWLLFTNGTEITIAVLGTP